MATRPPGFVEYPKWLYHRKHGGRIFNSANETKWLWLRGWKEQPFPPNSLGAPAAIKAWWQEWEWLFKAIGVLIGVAAAVVALLKVF